ncbi:MAG: DUF6443 domain-containing protein, partial [Bacteroidota bacterium]|nr:DUF6443 domain-containing protein [Bacteroidota bacterium]
MKSILLVFLLFIIPVVSMAQITYYESTGSFDDGHGSGTYPDNYDQTYLISCEGAVRIELSFPRFDTEGGYDKVYVYDGNTQDGNKLIGQYDNDNPPPSVIASTGPNILIRFKTNESYGRDGWTALYTAMYKNVYRLDYTQSNGCIVAGGPGTQCGNGMEGSYVIKIEDAASINLNFSYFNLETDNDFLYVYDGESISAPLLGAFTGSNLPPEINSSGGSLCLCFVTNNSVPSIGWAANYKSYSNHYSKSTLSPSQNYLYTAIPQMPVKEFYASEIEANSNILIEEVTYHDGLGRPSQKTLINNSPSGKDVIVPIAYDDFGREAVKYLPYTLDKAGAFDESALTSQSSFYQNSPNGITKDAYPFAVTQFEASPLNRVQKQGAPGETWQPDKHPVSIDYLTNTGSEALLWRVDTNGNLALSSQNNGYYAAGELYVTKTTDENQDSIKEYKDKEGHVVMKSVYDGAVWLKTCYVYDDFGLLRYVLPPKAFDQLAGIPSGVNDAEVITGNTTKNAYEGKSYALQSGASLTLTSGFNFAASSGASFTVAQASSQNTADVLKNLAYQYTYDTRNRMIGKKLPGAGWISMVYDKRDRLVLSQDSVQHSANKWLFTKYDELNRPVTTGLITIVDTRNNIQQALDNTVYGTSSPRSYFVTRTNTGEIGYSD